MKKAILTLLLTSSSIAAFSQAAKVTSAYLYMQHNEMDKAKPAIDAAALDEKTKIDAKTWLYRGQIYFSIASDKKWANIADGAVMKAYESYKEGLRLDPKNKYPELREGMKALATSLFNEGVNAYSGHNYEAVFPNFNAYYEAMKNKEVETYMLGIFKANKIDSQSIRYYLAASAYQLKNYPLALGYFNQLIVNKYKTPEVYTIPAYIYQEMKDTAKALEVLQIGAQVVADSLKKNILTEELAIYVKQGKKQVAVEKGKAAIAYDPDNISIYLALGSIYESMNMDKEAGDLYTQAYNRKPEDPATNEAMGIYTFNQGAAKYNLSVKEKDMKKATALENTAKDIWKKCIPFLEKALASKPTDNTLLDTISQAYAQIGDTDKALEYKHRIK